MANSTKLLLVFAGLSLLLLQHGKEVCGVVTQRDLQAALPQNNNGGLFNRLRNFETKQKRQTNGPATLPTELFEDVDAPTEKPIVYQPAPQQQVQQQQQQQQQQPQPQPTNNNPENFYETNSNAPFNLAGVPEPFRSQIIKSLMNSGYSADGQNLLPPSQAQQFSDSGPTWSNVPFNGGGGGGSRRQFYTWSSGPVETVREVYSSVNGGPLVRTSSTRSSGANQIPTGFHRSFSSAGGSDGGFPGFSSDSFGNGDASNGFYRVQSSQTSYDSNSAGPVTRHFQWDSRNGGRTYFD